MSRDTILHECRLTIFQPVIVVPLVVEEYCLASLFGKNGHLRDILMLQKYSPLMS